MSLPKTADRKSVGVKTDDIKMKGNLLKLKTKKFKYFVLRDETDSTRARLEYYPDERTFLANQTPPRRSIILKDCLNINKGEPILKSGKFSLDHYDLSKISSFTSDASPSGATNQGINVFKKYVLYIYTHKDVFKIGFPSEAEQEEWFFMMQQLRSKSIKKETITNEFEHVWPVKLVPQSYGCGRKMKSGFYHFCLNNKFVNLIRMTDKEEDSAIYSFALSEIKKIGDSHKYFIMIIGSGSALGEGALWFLVEDIQIAKNMHTIVYNAMISKPTQRRPAFTAPVIQFLQRFHQSKAKKEKEAKSSKTSSSGTPPKVLAPGSAADGNTRDSSRSSLSSAGSQATTFTYFRLCPHHGGDYDGSYMPMDPDASIQPNSYDPGYFRTTSFGSQNQYREMKSGLKEEDKSSSAPHLKNEGEKSGDIAASAADASCGGSGAAVGGDDGAGRGAKAKSAKPPKYTWYCNKCSQSNYSSIPNFDPYADLTFDSTSTSTKSLLGGKKQRATGKKPILDPKEQKIKEHFETIRIIEESSKQHPDDFRPRLSTAPSSQPASQLSRIRTYTESTKSSCKGYARNIMSKGRRTLPSSSLDEGPSYLPMNAHLFQSEFNPDSDDMYINMSLAPDEKEEEVYERMSFKTSSRFKSTTPAPTRAAVSSMSSNDRNSTNSEVFISPLPACPNYLEMKITTTATTSAATTTTFTSTTRTSSSSTNSPPSSASPLSSALSLVPTATMTTSTTTLTFSDYLPMNFDNKPPHN